MTSPLPGRVLHGRVLHEGEARGRSLVLDEPLSFWGGFDPVSGLVIDQAHPQHGLSLSGRVVVMPGSRGSAGTPGVVAESIRLGTGPVGLVVAKADVNLTAGAVVAGALYDVNCPVVLISDAELRGLADGVDLEISPSGEIRSGPTPR